MHISSCKHTWVSLCNTLQHIPLLTGLHPIMQAHLGILTIVSAEHKATPYKRKLVVYRLQLKFACALIAKFEIHINSQLPVAVDQLQWHRRVSLVVVVIVSSLSTDAGAR